MLRDPNEKALSAQTQGFVPNEGICKGKRGKCLTKQQTWKPKRRIENVLNEMIDTKTKLQKDSQRKKNRRKRKRGPRVLVAKL